MYRQLLFGLAKDIWVRVDHLLMHPNPVDREAYVRALIGSRRILQKALGDLNDLYREHVLMPEVASVREHQLSLDSDRERSQAHCKNEALEEEETDAEAATKAITFYILARLRQGHATLG